MKYSWTLFLLFPLLEIEAWHGSYRLNEDENSKRLVKRDVQSGPCMGDLGCFPITKDFIDWRKRPLNVFPRSSKTKFLLNTKNNSKEGYLLIRNNETSLINSPLKNSVMTIFIVHGFVAKPKTAKWLHEMIEELLKNNDYNVITVDWSGGNQIPYTQAVANTRVVGAEIASLINKMKETRGVNPESCHIIGHSLGAHIAGYAGERLKTLGKITALDPAGPYFEGMPTSVRIDPTDANFVDAIHSDMSIPISIGLGIKQTVGHIDFYPNKGFNQPGCDNKNKAKTFMNNNVMNGIKNALLCSHLRAVFFYTASINSDQCQFGAYRCSNWNEFLDGKCTDCGPDNRNCAIMGFHTDKPVEDSNTKFFLQTQDNSPFCGYQYRVNIHLQNGQDAKLEGKIQLALKHSPKKELTLNINEKSTPLKPGIILKRVITTPYKLNSSNTVGISWESSIHDETLTLGVDRVEIISINLIDKATQDSLVLSYQPKKNPLKVKEKVEMVLAKQ